jgi:hypothetical protein
MGTGIENPLNCILVFLVKIYYTVPENTQLSPGLSIAWIPLHPVFFSLFWGNVFFAFQHNLGTFCRGELLKLV